jgi:hypothetical protein
VIVGIVAQPALRRQWPIYDPEISRTNGGYPCTNGDTKCVRTADTICSAGLGADAGFQPRRATAAHGHRVVVARSHFNQFSIAVSPVSHHTVNVDDVAAVDANETVLVEPRLHFTDCQWTKQLESTVEYVRVVGIGMDGDHVLDGYEMGRAIALNRQMAGDARWRAARTSKRRISATAE